MKSLLLPILLCCSVFAHTQIYFESVTAPHDSPNISAIDEAYSGYQCAGSSIAIFSKYLLEDDWMKLDSSVNAALQIQYSPNGNLYIKRDTNILYSTNNGKNFTIIPLPPNSWTSLGFILNVLDDGILFLSTRIIGSGYYTLNNGQDWISTGLHFLTDFPLVKLVGDDIMIGDIDYRYTFHRIDLPTKEITSVELEGVQESWVRSATVLDDGTFFFKLDHIYGPVYLKYRFGEMLDYLGPFPELINYELLSSGNNLFAFGNSDYYVFSGETFIRHILQLDPFGSKEFIVSTNEHLYAVVDGHKIYRSTTPLSFLTRTQNTNPLLDLTLFPNPATDYISLNFSDNISWVVDAYEIVDQAGRIVFQEEYSLVEKIQVAYLASGIYNLLLKDKGQIVGIHSFVKH